MQIAALQVAIDDVGDKGPPKAIALCIAVLPLHLQLLKVILHTAIITARLGISGAVYADIIMSVGKALASVSFRAWLSASH
jgi:hypothetical protein